MKFGCCLNMVSTKPDGTGAELLDSLAKIGFDYAELPLAEMTALPEADFQNYPSGFTAKRYPLRML